MEDTGLDDHDEPPENLGRFARARAFVRTHRRRFQLGLIALFVTALAITYSDAYPREVTLAIPLGVDHGDVTEAHLELTQEHEAIRSIVYRWPSGAPAQLSETVELSPGDYDVAVTLIGRDGTASRHHSRVTSPAEGIVRLVLEDS